MYTPYQCHDVGHDHDNHEQGSRWNVCQNLNGLERTRHKNQRKNVLKFKKTRASLTKATSIHIKISTMYRQIKDFYARQWSGDLAHLHLKSAKKGFGPNFPFVVCKFRNQANFFFWSLQKGGWHFIDQPLVWNILREKKHIYIYTCKNIKLEGYLYSISIHRFIKHIVSVLLLVLTLSIRRPLITKGLKTVRKQ